MEKLRDIETIMRDFVALDERARFLTQGSREDHWAQEFIKNNFKAGAAQLFPNQATFGNVLDEMRALASCKGKDAGASADPISSMGKVH